MTGMRKRKWVAGPVGMCFLWLLLFGLGCSLRAQAEENRVPDLTGQTGSLQVKVSYTNDEGSDVPVPGVTFLVVQVASLEVAGGSAKYSWLDAYKNCGYSLDTMTAGSSIKAAAVLASTAGSSSAAAGRVYSGTTDQQGLSGKFTNLPVGMYLVYGFSNTKVESQTQQISIDPYLVQIPTPDPENNNAWNYDVLSIPKPGVGVEKVPIETKTEAKGDVSIVVVKHLVTKDGRSIAAENASFTVGLFEDPALTVLLHKKELKFEDVSSKMVTFKLTEGKTYYLAELDENGEVLRGSGTTIDGVRYQPSIEPGLEIVADRDADPVSFSNVFDSRPEEYTYVTEIELVKTTVKEDGSNFDINKSFYVGVFKDKKCTELATNLEENPIKVSMKGTHTSYIFFYLKAKTVKNGNTTYYLAETNRKGEAIGEAVGYTPDFGNGKRTLKVDVQKQKSLSVSLVNTVSTLDGNIEDEEGSGSSSGNASGQTLAGSGGSSDSSSAAGNGAGSSAGTAGGTADVAGVGSSAASSGDSVKTGDETPLAVWTFLLLVSAMAIGIALRRKLK